MPFTPHVTFTPMLRVDGRPRPELFGPDSLCVARGHALWRDIIAPVIPRWMTR